LLRISPPSVYKELPSQILELALHSCTFPKVVTEVREARINNLVVYVPVTSRVSELTATFVDYVYENPVRYYLWDWCCRVRGMPSGNLVDKPKLVGTGRLFWLAPSGQTRRGWKLVNLWPVSIDMGGGDMDRDEQNLITLVLRCDDVVRE
jgi:hypothetical protein